MPFRAKLLKCPVIEAILSVEPAMLYFLCQKQLSHTVYYLQLYRVFFLILGLTAY